MFVDLNNILDISEKQPPVGKTILVSSSETDNGFLVHHFLSMYVRSGFNVCMVSLAQSFSHYNNIGQKLGVNILAAKDNGKFIFIDGLKFIHELMSTSPVSGSSTDVQKNPFSFVLDNVISDKLNLKELYEHVKQAAVSLKEHRTVPLVVVIDDLGTLADLGVPASKITDMMFYLRHFVLSSLDQGCFLSAIQVDRDVGDEERELLFRQLAHSSDMQLHCNNLSSGYCKDVHGELLVTWLNPEQNHPFTSRSKKMQYKIMDKNVSFFASGMSAAVL